MKDHQKESTQAHKENFSWICHQKI